MPYKHVPPQWPSRRPCKIAFVTDHPRNDETYYGKTLIGGSGRVFDAMLRQANIERDDCLITNVFDEQPEDDDVVKAGWVKDRDRVAAQLERLRNDLEACRPTVIVPLGPIALWALTGDNTITNSRGSVRVATSLVPGVKLIPTFHPTHIIKAYHLMVMGVKDLVKAKLEAEIGPEIVHPRVELLIEPTIADILEFETECAASTKLSIDIETGWGQITAIAFAPTPERAMCIPFLDTRNPNNSYWPSIEDEAEAWSIVKRICENPVPKIGQNFMYDITWLWEKKAIRLINYRHDTRLRHKVLYPELPADLANMGASYTRFGSWKGWNHRSRAGEDKQDG